MPLKTKPVCVKCEKTESPMWQTTEIGVLCMECDKDMREQVETSNLTKTDNQDDQDTNSTKSNENGTSKGPRRSTRNTRQYKTRLNPFALPKTMMPKGKGRRFKKTPVKAPTAVATPITSESVFYKGSYIQVGDIVSMLDENDDVYYAQIRGLLTDQYCEKSAVITWLLPTEESPPPEENFDPSTYIIGPEEDLPRRLDCMEFIMHAPSDYFKTKNSPYPIVNATPSPGFIWTSIRPIDKFYTNINRINKNINIIENIDESTTDEISEIPCIEDLDYKEIDESEGEDVPTCSTDVTNIEIDIQDDIECTNNGNDIDLFSNNLTAGTSQIEVITE